MNLKGKKNGLDVAEPLAELFVIGERPIRTS